ncbi:Uncharacterized membrane protein YsdA, DUF1294 family [Oribacterium sp. KHPX15]|uniref:DUF1294 domain-containing protein n=1 Tax=Oribacterium sp. KHPX15 TaxID=1855342 RepID=UPI000895EA3D|nr:DUF1294 domain-containing protein [Oribacterium sp. KHPX15]SEA74851.1 Uncharacterized membrane protein YsdA, DUF1294 family [Oribacterium sp. KHPX15]
MIDVSIPYLIVINVIAFLLYGIDKEKARKGKWRISEKELILVAVIGGSVGAFFGMHFFHHKTRHWYFRYGIPAIVILQIILITVLKK